MLVARCLAVVVLVGLAAPAAAEDYPVVDKPAPAYAPAPAARYVDDIPIVQDAIAAPWEPVKRLSGPRRVSDGVAVPDGW